nr:DMT family transporter [Endozoicomonas sp. OPT23]
MVLAVMCWGGNSVAGRMSVGEIPPLALSFWRWFLALLVILPFTWKTVLRNRREVLSHWKAILPLAVLSISCFNSLLYLAVQTTQAVNIALLQVSLPVFTMVLAIPLLKQFPTKVQLLGMLIAVPGLILILGKGHWQSIIELNFGEGDLIMLSAVTLWAIYTVLLKRFTLPLSGAPMLTVFIAVGVVFILPFYLWELSIKGGFELNTSTVSLLSYVVIFASLVAYICWNFGVDVLGASNTALFNFLMPVFAAAFAIPLLGETLNHYHWTGAFLIFTGLWVSSRKQVKAG